MKMHTLFFALALLTAPLTANSGDIATERTQLANGGILAAIQTIENTISDIEDQIRIFEELNSEGIAFENFPVLQSILPTIQAVREIVAQGEAIAYTMGDLEYVMREKYKDYDEYLAIILGEGGWDREDFADRFATWSITHNDTIRNILEAQGFHAQDFADEEAVLANLYNLSRTSVGRMQAIQTGQLIAVEEVKQLQKLRQIVIEQSNLHASYFAQKQARTAAIEADKTATFEDRQDTILGDGKGYN